jgi:hypothetical protein
MFCSCVTTWTVESASAASTLSVPSVDASSTTVTSTTSGTEEAHTLRIISATVAHSL